MSVIDQEILWERNLLPERVSALTGEQFSEEFKAIRRNHFNALIGGGEFKEMAGACDFIKRLSAHLSGRVSIFTGSPKENADLEVAALGLDEYLPKEFRRYASDLPPGKGKPAPTGFHRAKEALGLKTGDAWISGGDRWKDFVGACAAGWCREFIAVAEDLNDSPFHRAFLDLKNKRGRFFDGTVLCDAARAQLNADLEELHSFPVFVPALHESCLEIEVIAPQP